MLRMQKQFIYFLVLVFSMVVMIAGPVGALAETSIESSKCVVAMAADPTGGYYLAFGDNVVQRFDAQNTKTAQRAFTLVRFIQYENGNLYVLDEQPEMPVLLCLDQQLQVISSESIPLKGYCMGMSIQGSWVWFITADENYQNSYVARYSMDTKTYELDEEIQMPVCIDAGTSQVALICESPQGMLSCLALADPQEWTIRILSDDFYASAIHLI